MIDRSKVLWLGGPPSPSDLQEHANRGRQTLWSRLKNWRVPVGLVTSG